MPSLVKKKTVLVASLVGLHGVNALNGTETKIVPTSMLQRSKNKTHQWDEESTADDSDDVTEISELESDDLEHSDSDNPDDNDDDEGIWPDDESGVIEYYGNLGKSFVGSMHSTISEIGKFSIALITANFPAIFGNICFWPFLTVLFTLFAKTVENFEEKVKKFVKKIGLIKESGSEVSSSNEESGSEVLSGTEGNSFWKRVSEYIRSMLQKILKFLPDSIIQPVMNCAWIFNLAIFGIVVAKSQFPEHGLLGSAVFSNLNTLNMSSFTIFLAVFAGGLYLLDNADINAKSKIKKVVTNEKDDEYDEDDDHSLKAFTCRMADAVSSLSTGLNWEEKKSDNNKYKNLHKDDAIYTFKLNPSFQPEQPQPEQLEQPEQPEQPLLEQRSYTQKVLDFVKKDTVIRRVIGAIMLTMGWLQTLFFVTGDVADLHKKSLSDLTEVLDGVNYIQFSANVKDNLRMISLDNALKKVCNAVPEKIQGTQKQIPTTWNAYMLSLIAHEKAGLSYNVKGRVKGFYWDQIFDRISELMSKVFDSIGNDKAVGVFNYSLLAISALMKDLFSTLSTPDEEDEEDEDEAVFKFSREYHPSKNTSVYARLMSSEYEETITPQDDFSTSLVTIGMLLLSPDVAEVMPRTFRSGKFSGAALMFVVLGSLVNLNEVQKKAVENATDSLKKVSTSTEQFLIMLPLKVHKDSTLPDNPDNLGVKERFRALWNREFEDTYLGDFIDFLKDTVSEQIFG